MQPLINRKRKVDDDEPAAVARRLATPGHACTGCHKAKVKCSGNFPCDRCVRKKLECKPHGRNPGRPCKKDAKVKSELQNQHEVDQAEWKGSKPDSWFKKTLRRTLGTAQRCVAPALALLTESLLHEPQQQGMAQPPAHDANTRDLVMGSIQGMISQPLPIDQIMTDARAMIAAPQVNMLNEPQSWLPHQFTNMMQSCAPTFLKVSVNGEHRILHNHAWQGVFRTTQELQYLAQNNMIDSSWHEFPLVPIIACPFERRKLISSLLQDLLKSHTTFDQQGVPIHESDSSTQICVCVNRFNEKFLALIKMRTCLLKQGAIGVQGMTFNVLPSSPHLLAEISNPVAAPVGQQSCNGFENVDFQEDTKDQVDHFDEFAMGGNVDAADMFGSSNPHDSMLNEFMTQAQAPNHAHPIPVHHSKCIPNQSIL